MDIIQSMLIRLLRPLVRILMRQGVTFDEFAEVAKRVFVDVADQEFRLEGRKQTISRISMLTGIQRKEVSRLMKLPDPETTELTRSYNRGVRIISGWRRDSDFATGKLPDSLPIEGTNSFAELVKKYSGDLPFRAVLDEFRRTGVVTEADGMISLNDTAGFVPDSVEDQLNIIGHTTRDLLETLSFNTDPNGVDESRLQLTVAYNNISAEDAEAFRTYSKQEGINLIHEFDAWLSSRDRDANPDHVTDASGTRTRTGVGIYFFEEPFEPEPTS